MPSKELQSRLVEAILLPTEEAKAAIDAALAAGADFISHDVQALMTAVSHGNLDTLRHLLLRGATLRGEHRMSNPERNASDLLHASSPLHEACEDGRIDMVVALLQADGAFAVNQFDYVARTPLAIAAQRGDLELMRLLVENGAQVNAHDQCHIGETAINYAIQSRQPHAILWLLANGADPTIPGWMLNTAMDRWTAELASEFPEVTAALQSAVRR